MINFGSKPDHVEQSSQDYVCCKKKGAKSPLKYEFLNFKHNQINTTNFSFVKSSRLIEVGEIQLLLYL